MHIMHMAKANYYLSIAKSGNNVIRDVFWAHFIYCFPKDHLCCCVFMSRSDVMAEIFADFSA